VRLYLDTSALVKLYVEQDGSSAVRRLVSQSRPVGTSALAYVEARAAFSRRKTEGHLTVAEHRRVVHDLDADWDRFVRLEVTEPLIREAADLAEAHRLRAHDAIHLASARVLKKRLDEVVLFATWDTHLNRAAEREGFENVR